MLEERDISELETIAENQRVSLAWVIRDAVSVYLSEKKAAAARKTTPSTNQGSS